MPKVADFIDKHRHELVSRLVEELARFPSARGLSDDLLENTYTEFLQTLAEISRRGEREDPVRARRRLEETHLSLRMRLGYTQAEVVHEYVVLGRLISSLWEGLPESEQPSLGDKQLLFGELQEAMDAAVAIFSGSTVEDRQNEKHYLRRLDAIPPERFGLGIDVAPGGERYEPLLDVIQEAMQADACELFLLEKDGETLSLAASVGLGGGSREPWRARVGDASFVGRVAVAESPLQLADVAAAESELVVPETVRRSGLHSLLGVRLWPSGSLLGVVTVGVKRAQPFEPQRRRRLETLCDALASLISRARLFERLQESENRLRLALSAADLGAWDFDPLTGSLRWDTRTRALFGYPPDAPIGWESFEHGIHPADRPAVMQAIERALDPRGTGEYDVIFRTTDDADVTWRFLRCNGRAFFDGGRAVRFIGTVQDVTELQAARDALQRSEQELRALAELMPQIVWTATPDGKVNYVNRQLAEYMGKPPEAALGFRWEELLHPDNLPSVVAAWARAVETGETYQVEQFLRRHDGAYRWHLTRAVPARDERGRVVRWLGTSTDIDDLKRAEHEIRASSEFERQLIGIVSHDLRNPLQVVSLSAQTLLRSEDLTDREARIVARLLTSAERATRLTHDLLDFTQVRLGGGLPVKRAPMDLRELAGQVVEESRLAHPERRVELETSGDSRGVWDADRLSQLLTNLLGNALAYSPPGTPVRVVLRGGDDAQEIEVRNEGPPIPPEQLPRLFQPLERGLQQDDRTSRSIGLGLFIVSSIVKAHGGEIHVRSSVQEGTTFIARLPRG